MEFELLSNKIHQNPILLIQVKTSKILVVCKIVIQLLKRKTQNEVINLAVLSQVAEWGMLIIKVALSLFPISTNQLAVHLTECWTANQTLFDLVLRNVHVHSMYTHHWEFPTHKKIIRM